MQRAGGQARADVLLQTLSRQSQVGTCSGTWSEAVACTVVEAGRSPPWLMTLHPASEAIRRAWGCDVALRDNAGSPTCIHLQLE